MHHRKASIFLSSTATIVLGWLIPYLQAYAMQYVTMWTPFPGLLKGVGFSGGQLTWALFPIDFVTWVLIALPIALILTRLSPARLVWYTALATLPFFLAMNIRLLADGNLLLTGLLVREWIGWLFVLPCAVLVVNGLARVRPNNSFKPKPLRGSA